MGLASSIFCMVIFTWCCLGPNKLQATQINIAPRGGGFISLMKIYTKTGDKGQTSLISGARVEKSHPAISAYGTLDELNSQIGLLLAELQMANPMRPLLQQQLNVLFHVQHLLFNMGSRFAAGDPEILSKLPSFPSKASATLEQQIDQMTQELPPLSQFILPGGHPMAALCHICRTITRRAERKALLVPDFASSFEQDLVFLNRLSDYFFVLARLTNQNFEQSEPTWNPQHTLA